MNLNKDYLLTVDIKQATVSVPNNMSFYITDIKTANIFAQLVINESSSDLIKKYAPVENAQDFEITLRLIKPNNEFKELKFTLLNQLEAFFMVDLTDEFKDYIGTYNCELFVDCVVNGELERVTTSSFNYKVNKSIVNDLDDVIEGDPDYPILDELLDRLEGIDTDGFVTEEYVNEALEGVALEDDIPNMINSYLTGYRDNIALSAPFKMMGKPNVPLDARTVVNTESDIMNIEYPYVGMIVYVKDTGKRYEVLTLAPKQVGFAAIPNMCVGTYKELDYATTEYVDNAVSNVDLSVYAPIDSPNFTTAISMGRAADTTVGANSVALGNNVTASSHYSHAEGASTTASGRCSHAEGRNTIASGQDSHAEGCYTIAAGRQQHAQGILNIEDTANKYAHIIGNGRSAQGGTIRSNAHTVDWSGNAWFAGDVYVGGTSQDDANKLISTDDIRIIGGEEETYILTPDNIEEDIFAPYVFNNVSIGGDTYDNELLMVETWMDDDYKRVYLVSLYGYWVDYKENDNGEFERVDDGHFVDNWVLENHTHNEYATTEHTHDEYAPIDSPNFTTAISMGRKADTTVGKSSTALGLDVTASAMYSHAEGNRTTASAPYSHAEGNGTTASNPASHAEGSNTTAKGIASHAEGESTTASGSASHAEGENTTAGGPHSHAEGEGTIALSDNQHVQGRYNVVDPAYAHIVGNGDSGTRSNAHTLDWNGNAWFAGEVTVGADNEVLATESYVDEAVVNAGGVIQVIGGEEETHIFTPDDIPDDSSKTYLFKNVEFPYFDSNGNKTGTTYDYYLVSINTWLDGDTKYLEMIDAWGNYYTFYTDENNELVLEFEDCFVFREDFDSELENKADSEHTHDEYATTDYVDEAVAGINTSGLDLQYNMIEEIPNSVYSSLDTKGIAIKNTTSNSSISMEIGPSDSLVIQANVGGKNKHTIYDSTQSGVSVYSSGTATSWQPESGYCPNGYFYWEGSDLCFIDPYGNEYRVTLEPK